MTVIFLRPLWNKASVSFLKENKLIKKIIEIYNTLIPKIDDNIDLEEKFTPESISPFLDYDNNSKIQVNTLNDNVEYIDYIWYTDPYIQLAGLILGILLVLNFTDGNTDDDDTVTFSISRVLSGGLILYNSFKDSIEIIFNRYKNNSTNNYNKINNNQNNNGINNIESINNNKINNNQNNNKINNIESINNNDSSSSINSSFPKTIKSIEEDSILNSIIDLLF